MRRLTLLLILIVSAAGLAQAQSMEQAPGSNLEQQLDWARSQSQASTQDAYWFGYAFRRSMRRSSHVMNNYHMNLRDGLVSTNGRSLLPLLDDPWAGIESGFGQDPDEMVTKTVALLLRFNGEQGRPGELENILLGNIELPFPLSGHPLVWAGQVEAVRGFELMSALYQRGPSEKARRELAGAAAFHDVPDQVLPFLDGVLADDESEKVRREAAEGLRMVQRPEAVRLLVRTLRQDQAERVRREAVEALGGITIPESQQALAQVLASNGEARLRQEAAEQLRRHKTPESIQALSQAAFSDQSQRVAREAVETMAHFKGEQGLQALRQVLYDHSDDKVRCEAAEALGKRRDEPSLALLRKAINDDLPPGVQKEVAESLGRYAPEQSLSSLISAAEKHPHAAVRREALEQIGRLAAEKALPTLQRVAENDSDYRVQREALEALLKLPEGRGVDTVITIARSHPSLRLRKAAIRELGDSSHPKAKKALIDLAKELER